MMAVVVVVAVEDVVAVATIDSTHVPGRDWKLPWKVVSGHITRTMAFLGDMAVPHAEVASEEAL